MNTTTMTKAEARKLVLENKKVAITSIPRTSDWQPVNQGAGEFDSSRGFSLPSYKTTGELVKILNEEEQLAFEILLDRKPGDLSFYNKDFGFWKKFAFSFSREGKILDLNDPKENLMHRICKVLPFFAPSWEEKDEDLIYTFAIVEEGYKEKEKATTLDRETEAFAFYGKIVDDKGKLAHVLKVYGVNKGEDKNVTVNSKSEWLKSEVGKILKSDLNGFLAISKDKDFDYKVMISDALYCKALLKHGKLGYALPGGEVIAKGIDEMVSFIKDPENNTIYATIKARIEAGK